MRVLAEKWKTAEHVAFGPGTQLAVGYSAGLAVWDAATGEQVARLRYSSAPSLPVAAKAVFFPPDGRAVYVADTHLGLCGFRPPDLAPEPIDRPDRLYLHAAAMSGDGRRLVCSAVWAGHRGLYLFRRQAGGPPVPDRDIPLGPHVSALGFLPDGDRFAAADYDPAAGLGGLYRLTVRSWPGGQVHATASHDRTVIGQVAVSPDGTRVVVMAGPSLLAWPTSLDRKPVRVAGGGRYYFTQVAFHPSSEVLAATSNNATVKLYDAATLALVRTYTWEIGRLKAVAFSADGTLAAAAGDGGRVIVWDVEV